MIRRLFIVTLLFPIIPFAGCKKDGKIARCNSAEPTIRQVTNKKATIQLSTLSTEPVYLVEEGTIDTKLIPCNLPSEFYENGLQVTISGDVKPVTGNNMAPCCVEGIDLTDIKR